MKVSCPSCSATLNIDDKKIPAGGARIKCPTCSNVFPVKPGAVALPGMAAPAPAAAAPPPVSGAVPLPGLSVAKPTRQNWEEAPTRAVPMSGIPGALTAAAPPSNVNVPPPGQPMSAAQSARTAVMPALTRTHLVNSAGAVPLPGPALPTSPFADFGSSEEQTSVGEIPRAPAPEPIDDGFSTDSVPQPTRIDAREQTLGSAGIAFSSPSGSVPLPGSSSEFTCTVTPDC